MAALSTLYRDQDCINVEVMHTNSKVPAIITVPESISVAEALVHVCAQVERPMPLSALRFGGIELDVGDTLHRHDIKTGAVLYLVDAEHGCDTNVANVLHQLRLRSDELQHAPASSCCTPRFLGFPIWPLMEQRNEFKTNYNPQETRMLPSGIGMGMGTVSMGEDLTLRTGEELQDKHTVCEPSGQQAVREHEEALKAVEARRVRRSLKKAELKAVEVAKESEAT